MCPGMPPIAGPVSIGGAIGGGGGGGGMTDGVGGRNGLPTHAASAGLDRHCGSSGPVGDSGSPGGVGAVGGPTQYGPPTQAAYPGFCKHRGSSGPVGRSAEKSAAFAGTRAGTSAITATATAIFATLTQACETNERIIEPPFECGRQLDHRIRRSAGQYLVPNALSKARQQQSYPRSSTRRPSENSRRTCGSPSEVDSSFSIRRIR